MQMVCRDGELQTLLGKFESLGRNGSGRAHPPNPNRPATKFCKISARAMHAKLKWAEKPVASRAPEKSSQSPL